MPTDQLGPPHISGAHEMYPPCDPDTFSDTENVVYTILPKTLTQSSNVVFVIKTLATGETTKYRVHCNLNATLAGLRDILQNDDDKIMSADDRFHQGDFCVAKSAESHTEWRNIVQVGPALNMVNPRSLIGPAG